MTRFQRSTFFIVCAVIGALVGGLAMMGAAALTRKDAPAREPAAQPSISNTITPGDDTAKPSKLAPQSSVLLAWTPGGLPANTEQVLERMTAVRAATTVEAGLDWIESSRSPEGTVLDRTPGGMAIPFENAYIEPADYADFIPLADRDEIRALDQGDAVFAQTSEELRGGGVGTSLRLKGGSLDVTGVVADVTTGGYEALTAGSAPKRWPTVDRFVLIRLAPNANPDPVERRIRRLLQPGQGLRLRPSGVNPFLRYGDAVLPQLIMKKTFGEFSLQPQAGSDFFEIDRSWQARNIRAAQVPVLGKVT
ncbi:MAG: ABC transporter permease, partial [Actinomycetota bacterium]